MSRPPGSARLAFQKDPANPQNDDDPAIQLYKEKVGQYAGGADPTNSLVLNGWIAADLFVKTAESMECVSRTALMQAARNLDGVEVAGLLEGITATTDGLEDGFPVETLQLMRYEGEQWQLFGEPIDTRAEFGPLEARRSSAGGVAPEE